MVVTWKSDITTKDQQNNVIRICNAYIGEYKGEYDVSFTALMNHCSSLENYLRKKHYETDQFLYGFI